MSTLIFLTLAIGCGGEIQHIDDDSKDQKDPVTDEIGPVVDHEEIEESQPGGVAVQVTAEVWDEEGTVLYVELNYSQSTSTEWQTVSMAMDPSTGEYVGQIPGMHVGSAEMRYYIYAVDSANNETIDPLDADVDRLEAYTFGVSTD